MNSTDAPGEGNEEMSDERHPGLWHIVWESGAAVPEIRDQQDNTIVTLAKSSDKKMWARASLISAAPELYEAAMAALQVFTVLAQRFEGPVAESAQEMIPMLESVINAPNVLGQITKGAMVGK